jgi:hypothetical protein
MLGSTQSLSLWQSGRDCVDLVDEPLQERSASVRGDLTRVVPRVHLVSSKGRTKRALLGR